MKPPNIHSRIYRQIYRFSALLLILTMLLPALPGVAYAQDTDTPVLWLKLDESAGATTFANAAGAGNNAACTGDTCPTSGATGKIGQAAQFDGTDDKITSGLAGPFGNFSLAAWVNYSGNAYTGWHTIIEFGDDAPWFGINQEGQLALYPGITGGSVPVGQWSHVAYSWDGTNNRLYVNGALVASNTEEPPFTGDGIQIGDENGTSSPWLGLLDDIRVYEKALSAAEVNALAKSTPNAPVAPINVTPPDQPEPNNPTPQTAARFIDLTVSLYREAQDAETRKPYEAFFGLFADAMFEATNGQHKVRNITIYDSGRFADRANVKWVAVESSPRASMHGYHRGGTVHHGDELFTGGEPISATDADGNFTNLAFHMNTFSHEWGHYYYGMYDEYSLTTPRGGVPGPTDPHVGDKSPDPRAIMDAAGRSLNYSGYNFSSYQSTTAKGNTSTANYRGYQSSAWEALARPPSEDPQGVRGSRFYFPELRTVAPTQNSLPTDELPAQQNQARSALNVMWADANSTVAKQRVFLVDVSTGMAQIGRLAKTKRAIANYIDRANVGDRIGVTTFSETHTVVQELTAISDANRETLKGVVNAIQASTTSNKRNIEGADNAAIAALKATGGAGSIIDQSVYVFIDGGYTDRTSIFNDISSSHRNAKIPISVFNYAPNYKPGNDLISNAIEALAWATRSTRPNGTYTFVGEGGFDDGTLRAAGIQVAQESDVNTTEVIDALEDADKTTSTIVDVDLGTGHGAEIASGEIVSATIFTDGTLDELEVVVYFDGAEEDANVTLLDPDRFADTEPFCDSEEGETICFFSVFEPGSGEYEIQVEAVNGPIFIDYEAHGYAANGTTYQAEIKSNIGELVTYPQQVVLEARLFRQDNIAKAGVEAWVELPNDDEVDILFKDDGVAPDKESDDGLYTALMSYNQPGDHYVTVVFDNIEGEAVFTQKGLPDVEENTPTAVPDDFDRFATIEIFVNDFKADDHGSSAASASDIPANNEDVAGRIDSSSDTDVFRVTSPAPISGDPKASGVRVSAMGATSQSENPYLRISSVPTQLDLGVTVTTGELVKKYTPADLNLDDYDDYWSIPLELDPGEVAIIEVGPADAVQSASFLQDGSGSYAISFGQPLPDEASSTPQPESTTVFLPVIQR